MCLHLKAQRFFLTCDIISWTYILGLDESFRTTCVQYLWTQKKNIISILYIFQEDFTAKVNSWGQLSTGTSVKVYWELKKKMNQSNWRMKIHWKNRLLTLLRFKRWVTTLFLLFWPQLERQLIMQNEMRERQMAMQIAWSREFLKYFGTFFGIAAISLTAGYVCYLL